MSIISFLSRFGSLVVFALMLSTTQVNADVVVSAVSTSNNTLGVNKSPDQMIDQSGLLTPFTSGLTDLATYLGSNPLHASTNPGNLFASVANSGSIDFDLGSAFNIGTFILWGDDQLAAPQPNGSPKDFSLVGSLLPDFSVSTVLGSFTGAAANGSPILAQTFNFSGANVRYIRWNIQNVHGGTNVNVSEIAFGTAMQPVSEPSQIGVLMLGFISFVFARRRRLV